MKHKYGICLQKCGAYLFAVLYMLAVSTNKLFGDILEDILNQFLKLKGISYTDEPKSYEHYFTLRMALYIAANRPFFFYSV